MKRIAAVFLFFVFITACGESVSVYASGNQASDLLEKVKLGREMLQAIPLNYVRGVTGYRRVKVRRRTYRQAPIYGVVSQEIAMVVLRDDTGELEIVRGLKTGDSFAVTTPGYQVTMNEENGVNTEFDTEQGRVVAVKQLLFNAFDKPGVTAAIYTPYCHRFVEPAVIQEGFQRLKDLDARARVKLNVFSRAFPSLPVTEVIDPELIQILIIIEHITPSEMQLKGVDYVVNKVLVTLALNGDDSYGYSRSSANAFGLAQFIRSSYNMIRANYASAGLIPDFIEGMRNVENAIMAMILLNDLNLASLNSLYGDSLTPEAKKRLLAAAYNGGLKAARALARREGLVGKVPTVINHTANSVGYGDAPSYATLADYNDVSRYIQQVSWSGRQSSARSGRKVKATRRSARTARLKGKKSSPTVARRERTRYKSRRAVYALPAETSVYVDKYELVRRYLASLETQNASMKIPQSGY